MSKNSGYVISFRKRQKRRAVELMGGKCCICGYSKCLRALTFHHIDPLTKSFEIGGGLNKSWERVKEELKKCLLLCANCHAEIHEGQHSRGRGATTKDDAK